MMRLDKFLSVARIFKSRSLAGEAISSGMVFVDGLPAKSSKDVSAGSIIEINTPLFFKKIEVSMVPRGNISRKEASSLYTVIDERTRS